MPEFLHGFIWKLERIWYAIWLGLLDTDDLNGITWTYYMGDSGFDSEDFNINHGFLAWEDEAVRKNFSGCKRVLVAGAGGGREVIALSRLGYEVTAFDFSPNLTIACRRNLNKSECLAIVLDAPPDRLPQELKVYDALLIGRGFYHHIPSRIRRVAFLESCRAKLEVGAPVVISDFFTRRKGSKFYLYTKTIANFLRRLRHSTDRVELGDWLNNCLQHAFTMEEFEQELSEASIVLKSCAVSPFGESSRLAYAVGQAK